MPVADESYEILSDCFSGTEDEDVQCGSPGLEDANEEPLDPWETILTVISGLIKDDRLCSLISSIFNDWIFQDDQSPPCVIMNEETGHIEHATEGFANLFCNTMSKLTPEEKTHLGNIIKSGSLDVDRLVNGNKAAKLVGNFRARQEEHTCRNGHHGSILPCRPGEDLIDMIQIMIGLDATDKPCWMMLWPLRVPVPGRACNQIVILVTVLKTPVADSLFKMTMIPNVEDFFAPFMTEVHQGIKSAVERGKDKRWEMSWRNIERCCKSFGDHLKTFVGGDHVVPLVGMDCVKRFDELQAWDGVFGHVEQALKTAWECTDEVFRATRVQGGKSVACAVSDPTGTDCPLVYISPGFESLTKYPRSYALGRNCRFLQPAELQRNIDINGHEVGRMKIFCTQLKHGSIMNLLFNVDMDGYHFWNILFMDHLYLEESRFRGKHYIFGVQTNIVGTRKDDLDTLILAAWDSGEGKKRLLSLRQHVFQAARTYSPIVSSLKKLMDDQIVMWLRDLESPFSYQAGGDYVDLSVRPSVLLFGGKFLRLMEEAEHNIRALLDITYQSFTKLKEDTEESVSFTVADPSHANCPLVFVSKGFEAMTEYNREFAVGRCCRFLQPTMDDINCKVNGDEIQRIVQFCETPEESADPENAKMVNLMLNEKRNGERFWMLMYMQKFEIDGKLYIVSFHKCLDVLVPLAITDRNTIDGNHEFLLSTLADDMSQFLNQIRTGLREDESTNMVEAAEYARASIQNFLKRHCDDWEGDHYIPRMGKKVVQDFEIDVTWKSVLHSIQNLLVEIWDVSEFRDEEVACAVSDPNGDDCPLVYVSRKFEDITGYPREWVLGRNCRFLQPNDSRRNMHLNQEDKSRMRDFCSKAQPKGTRIINLLVNERRDSFPFWNLLVMEHIDVNGRDLIFAVQTKIDVNCDKLAEIFAMDNDGRTELSRLRTLLRSKEQNLEKIGMKAISKSIVQEWASELPGHLQLRSLDVNYQDAHHVVPALGLLVPPNKELFEVVQRGLDDGVRHFALCLNSEECRADPKYVENIGHLLIFKLAEMLQRLHAMSLHYLRDAIKFSLITRPQYVGTFHGISKAMASSSWSITCWFLDVSAINPDKQMAKAAVDKLLECWRTMAAARKAGDAEAIGIYGPLSAVMVAMEHLKHQSPVSIIAVDDYPTKDHSLSMLEKFRKLHVQEYGNPPLLTYNLYGPNDCLLKDEIVQDHAKLMNISACASLFQWAEMQGYGALVSRITDRDTDENKHYPRFHRAFTRAIADAPPVSAEDFDTLFEDVRMQNGTSRCAITHTKSMPVMQQQTPRMSIAASVCQSNRGSIATDLAEAACPSFTARHSLRSSAGSVAGSILGGHVIQPGGDSDLPMTARRSVKRATIGSTISDAGGDSDLPMASRRSVKRSTMGSTISDLKQPSADEAADDALPVHKRRSNKSLTLPPLPYFNELSEVVKDKVMSELEKEDDEEAEEADFEAKAAISFNDTKSTPAAPKGKRSLFNLWRNPQKKPSLKSPLMQAGNGVVEGRRRSDEPPSSQSLSPRPQQTEDSPLDSSDDEDVSEARRGSTGRQQGKRGGSLQSLQETSDDEGEFVGHRGSTGQPVTKSRSSLQKLQDKESVKEHFRQEVEALKRKANTNKVQLQSARRDVRTLTVTEGRVVPTSAIGGEFSPRNNMISMPEGEKPTFRRPGKARTIGASFFASTGHDEIDMSLQPPRTPSRVPSKTPSGRPSRNASKVLGG